MRMPRLATEPSHRQIFAMSWPIIIANTANPLLGLVDTAVIGNFGSVHDLGAIALGALIFLFIYWAFGFLRMATTGFVAQADGRSDSAEVRATVARGLLLAATVGLMLIGLQQPIEWLAMELFGASTAVESGASDYLRTRIWAAPAALGLFVIMGTLIGLGLSRQLLWLQLLMNGLNMLLDIYFAGHLGWGASGIAMGTALAEWITLSVGLMLIWHQLRRRHRDPEAFWPAARLGDMGKLRALMQANTDIMIRTLLLLACFGWFTHQGARFGDAVLAANHVLLQLISFSAFFLDGFAFAAESVVGQALGRGQRERFDAAVYRSTHFSASTALLLSALLLLLGGGIITLLTDLPAVQALAQDFLPWCALYVLLSFGAFQLDGIFIGATRTRAMRNASAASAAGFLLLAYPAIHYAGNTGLWAAFCGYVLLRALCLMPAYPALRRSLTDHVSASD